MAILGLQRPGIFCVLSSPKRLQALKNQFGVGWETGRFWRASDALQLGGFFMMTPEQKKAYNRAYYAARAERLRTEALERHHKRKRAGLVDAASKAAYDKAYRAANPEKGKRTVEEERLHSARFKQRYQTDSDVRGKKLMNCKKWGASNKPKVRDMNLRKKYGITAQQVDEILVAQGNKCAICGDGPNGHYRHFPAIDHCHKTKKVRGLLCQKCNRGLGLFRDSPNLLKAAVAYLERA